MFIFQNCNNVFYFFPIPIPYSKKKLVFSKKKKKPQKTFQIRNLKTPLPFCLSNTWIKFGFCLNFSATTESTIAALRFVSPRAALHSSLMAKSTIRSRQSCCSLTVPGNSVSQQLAIECKRVFLSFFFSKNKNKSTLD